MQLTTMPDEGRKTHDLPMIRGRVSSYCTVSQHKSIDAIGFPHLCELLAAFLETEPITQRFRVVALHAFERCKFPDLLVKPMLAHFQGRKTSVPPTLAFPGGCSNVFHDKYAHRKHLTEKPSQPEFPLPA